jgi:uncharacterized protein YjbI with pentapeptide repeats
MANEEHVEILKKGLETWRMWRKTAKGQIDLSRASLSAINLSEYDLSYCNLQGANLKGANLAKAWLHSAYLGEADLSGATLTDCGMIRTGFYRANLGGADMRRVDASYSFFKGANLHKATLVDADLSGAWLVHHEAMDRDDDPTSHCDLSEADLSGASLRNANLDRAILRRANLTGANLTGAYCSRGDFAGANLSDSDLSQAVLVEADFTDATITGARIYGVSAWNVNLASTAQHDLIISRWDEPAVTVDNLEVGQFIYLILNNTKIRSVIDTITSKGVLILGRFADPQRKAVLDGLRQKLREFNLMPIVFDFDRPTDKDYTETVQTLVGMSMFVIADVTLPKSTPLELEATVKQFKVPYLPIIDVSVDPRPFAMIVDSQKSFHWVLSTLAYESKEELLDHENLKTYIIDRAMAKREELRKAKNDEPEVLRIPRKTSTPISG